jgi:polyisoprenoid-binding protein YceI
MAKWNIETVHSAVHFKVRHMMVTDVNGLFNSISGEIAFDPNNIINTSITAEIDASSIYTGNEPRDRHLRNEDFLDAANFPRIVFKSSDVESAGSNSLKIHGDLTIRNVTRPVLLDTEYFGPATYEDETGIYTSMGFSAATQINREDFGITWNNYFGAGNFMVGKYVDITINIEADLQSE